MTTISYEAVPAVEGDSAAAPGNTLVMKFGGTSWKPEKLPLINEPALAPDDKASRAANVRQQPDRFML